MGCDWSNVVAIWASEWSGADRLVETATVIADGVRASVSSEGCDA